MRTMTPRLLDFLKRTGMTARAGSSGNWIALGGNRWIDRKTAKETEGVTREIIRRGYSIVTGGAEGVDHVVMDACLKYRIRPGRLRVFLPSTIEEQYRHYRKLEGAKRAKELFGTLLKLKNADPKAIKENRRTFPGYREAANFRNSLILEKASGAIIIKPKASRGSMDALDRIRNMGLPHIVFE